MEQNKPTGKFLRRFLSYVLVATLASGVTWMLASTVPSSKLEQVSALIQQRYIGQSDRTELEDRAAAAMVSSLGDRWSTYIPADQYQDHKNNRNNEYVGIGVTILRQEGLGLEILEVAEGGPAEEAGVRVGDFITHVEGQDMTLGGEDRSRELISGKVNTTVRLTLRRGDEILELTVERRVIHQAAAEGRMLEGQIGLITVSNFHKDAGSETIARIEELLEQGAQKLIFDLRDNPGGYVDEMNLVLDYLLPEGPLFRSLDYKGNEEVDTSDERCLELPMAVLINGNSYSAAEFFAAALSEYDWAITVGLPTTGKGYFQNTLELMDGSALYLSVGKYFTPQGVSLADAGGLTPDITVEPGLGADGQDLQLQAAIDGLNRNDP